MEIITRIVLPCRAGNRDCGHPEHASGMERVPLRAHVDAVTGQDRAGWHQRIHRHVRHEWGSLSAAATTIVAPVVLMALLLRRHLIEGLTLGAVK